MSLSEENNVVYQRFTDYNFYNVRKQLSIKEVVVEDVLIGGRKYSYEYTNIGRIFIKDHKRGVDTKDRWILNEDHFSDTDWLFWVKTKEKDWPNNESAVNSVIRNLGGFTVYNSYWMAGEQYVKKSGITLSFYDNRSGGICKVRVNADDVWLVKKFLTMHPKTEDALSDFSYHKSSVFLRERNGALKPLSAKHQEEIGIFDKKVIQGHFSIREDLRDIADKYLEFQYLPKYPY